MIRARLSDGRFIFGLDAENLRRLRQRMPIVIDLAELGGTDKLMLMYGDTMADIARELEAATGQKLPVAQPYPPPKGRQ